MITKEQLTELGFAQWDRNSKEWSYDTDYNNIQFNIVDQCLYDHDESTGEAVKLCHISDIDSLVDMVYRYFNIDLTVAPEESLYTSTDIMNAFHAVELAENKNYSVLWAKIRKKLKSSI